MVEYTDQLTSQLTDRGEVGQQLIARGTADQLVQRVVVLPVRLLVSK